MIENGNTRTYLQNNWNELTKGMDVVKTSYYKQLMELYSSPNRHYHNTIHINTLLQLLDTYAHLLAAPRAIQFAIWYHDAIYDSSQTDNEAKSADLAYTHMTALGVGQPVVDTCCKLIRATQTHTLGDDLRSFDAQFLLDIDLAILATKEEEYLQYTKNIRQEYIMYPEPVYIAGRKKVIEHFLAMDRIYKTDLCFELYEELAKKNLNRELKLLG